jgi:TolB protein
MNKKFFLLIFSFCISNAEQLALQVQAQQYSKMNIMLCPLNQSAQLQEILSYMQKALEFNNQFSVTIKPLQKILTKQELKQLWIDGYPFLIFLQMNSSDSLQWRLYDTQSAIMLSGKKMHNNSSQIRAFAYSISDSLWQELMGQPGFFSTKIAYCKEISSEKKRYKHIYIADYDGSHEQAIVQSPTINIAPRWNKDQSRPLLFYSESTNENVRMMAATMKKEKIMASNFEGLNMLPTFSNDGKTVIYCATRGTGNCQLYQWHNRSIKKLTQNDGNNICPILSEDGHLLFFSSDFESGAPQIYCYNLQTEKLERITQDGYCVSPSYCAKSKNVAYAKMVNGIMQLFSYNLITKQHMQLTFDDAQKEECSWSPCGKFLLCPVNNGKTSRIALFNKISKQYTYLTNEKDNCSYPTWSGVYTEYPVILA